MSIALLQGEVELENIPLRRDALRFVDSSLEVVNGVVGKVKLKIPVSRLRSEPWSISLEKVYVVIAPQKHDDYDELQDEAVHQEIKMAALDGIESDWRAKHDTEYSSSYYPSYTSWMTFGTSLIGTIIDNLQVEINDVHLRFEDDVSIPSRVFACGISLSLSAQSCDSNWVPKFVQRDKHGDNMAFKLIELQNMSAYVNTDTQSFQSVTHEELLRKMATTNRAAFQANEYIIHPVSANAMMKRNCASKPLNSKKSPRIACEIELGSVELDIKDIQYQSCVMAARTLHQLHKNRKFWKWRPHGNVKGNAKAWWQYAITCHMEVIHGNNISRTWENALNKARENVAYVQAFKRHLQNPVVLDPEDKEIKENLDSSRPYEELKILREQAVIMLEHEMGTPHETASNTPPPHVSEEEEGAVAQSVLQGWFPMWWGWYDTSQEESDETNSSQNESVLEDELIEVLTDEASTTNLVAYKDVVFLQAQFCLSKSSIKLFSSSSLSGEDEDKLLFELECTQAKLEFEHRPRTSSNKVAVSLDAIYARDHITPDTSFPLLVSPQSAQGAPLFPKKSSSSATASSAAASFGLSNLAKTLQNYMGSGSKNNEPIFYLLYEKKPFASSGGGGGKATSKVDYRLHIKSQPLNIVYNPAVMNFLQNFFKIPEDLNRVAQLSQKIRDAAFHRMEEVKAKTKEEVRKNIGLLLDDTHRTLWKKSWDVMLELSAPQIIIPEHFVDKEALLLVVDLGKLHMDNGGRQPKPEVTPAAKSRPSQNLFPYFTTANTQSAAESDSEDDEEFVTPASSPNSPAIKSDGENESFSKINMESEDTFKCKMYETFSIHLTNLQVIVGRMKDNWRHAHVKGTSALHILDKFSIALQLQRRTVPTDDVDMPKFALSGTLPKLSIHINEHKIHALEIFRQLLLAESDDAQAPSTQYDNRSSVSTQTPMPVSTLNPIASTNSESPPIFDSTQLKSEEMLILVYFCVNDMSIELQSLEKSIVELQVTGVKASLTKRLEETNLGLSVHSLLLVDAIQTLGPNFELLIASHKNVSVDSISGSLRGSDPVSPCSPVSPNPAAATTEDKLTNPAEIAKALSALQRNKSNSQLGAAPSSASPPSQVLSSSPFAIDAVDPDALISVDITLLHKTNEEAMQIISIQFNSLDVIANQETIVELLSFARRVMPGEMISSHEGMQRRRKFPTKEQIVQTDFTNEDETGFESQAHPSIDEVEAESPPKTSTTGRGIRTEVTADFQRLNVLLLRAGTGKMIGTALLTEARIHAELADSISATGSLGGLQVNSLLPGSQLHQRIISVGKDPAAEEMKKARASIHSELYNDWKSEKEDDIQALSFNIVYKTMTSTSGKSHAVALEIRMASVCYLHSTPFIHELNSCATDFLHFLRNLASSIGSAATDLALGMVQRRTESLSRQVDMNDIYWSPLKYGSLKRSKQKLDKELIEAPAPTPRTVKGYEANKAFDVEVSIDVQLETPIVVLPRNERSNEVLVAHLGLISIRNEAEQTEANGGRVDRVLVKVEKMNMLCIDLMRQTKSHFQKSASLDVDVLELFSMAKSLTAIELYSDSTRTAEPILHNTEVSINVERYDLPNFMQESESFHSITGDVTENMDTMRTSTTGGKISGQSFHVHGQVINPLKVSLHRGQYCQILETISTLGKSSTVEDEFRGRQRPVASELPKPNRIHVPINGSFMVPMLQLELCSESAGTASRGQALVGVCLEDFAVSYENFDGLESTIEVTLGSVIAEDLSLSRDSPHRILATSIGWESSQSHDRQRWKTSSAAGLSTSCPRLASVGGGLSKSDMKAKSDSLPEKLNHVTAFSHHNPRPFAAHPATPPPSLCGGSGRNSPAYDSLTTNLGHRREGNLVLVKIVNVLAETEDFDGVNRYVDVDFNTLDIVFSLQSWVIILDFFGIGSPSDKDVKAPVKTSKPQADEERQHFNSDFNIKVKALSVILNHSNYEVARASVNSFVSRLSLSEGNFSIHGSLRKFLVTDLTKEGELYR